MPEWRKPLVSHFPDRVVISKFSFGFPTFQTLEMSIKLLQHNSSGHRDMHYPPKVFHNGNQQIPNSELNRNCCSLIRINPPTFCFIVSDSKVPYSTIISKNHLKASSSSSPTTCDTVFSHPHQKDATHALNSESFNDIQ